MDTEWEFSDEPENEFLFETDHLALKGNKDYKKLLKYIVYLEVSKIKTLKDIEKLSEIQNKALDDPEKFVEKLQEGLIQFPERHLIPEMPKIDWAKYDINEHTDFDHSNNYGNKNSNNIQFKVRGRVFTDSKPETFNQLWSCEEQRRLEELLEIYPEEEIEARRYKKIANALGSRTPLQVMSRVQKYFNKLAKAGLPIPGRIPRLAQKGKIKSSFYFKKSTFFPQLNVPVKMEELGQIGEPEEKCNTPNSVTALQLLKMAKEQRILDQQSPIVQTKSVCIGCNQTGYLGARWTDNSGTDYCTDCIIRLLPKENLTPVRIPNC